MATQAEVAAHLDLTDRTVRDLKKRGVFSADGRGQMDLDACRVAYIRHLRERAAGRSSDDAEAEGLDLTAERAALAREQRIHFAMKNAALRKELVPIAAYSAAVVAVLEMIKAKLGRVPAKVAKSDGKLKVRIADALEDALDELSVARIEEELGGDGDDDDADADD
jgi:phage terminase Nu1 subunit (DNA packaging protein)